MCRNRRKSRHSARLGTGTPWSGKLRMPVYGIPVRDSSCRWGCFPGDRDRVRADRLRASAPTTEGLAAGNEAAGTLVRGPSGPQRAGVFGHAAGAMLGNSAMTQALRPSEGRGVGPRLSVELQGLGAPPRRGQAALGVRAGARRGLGNGGPRTPGDDLLEKRRPVMQRWAGLHRGIGVTSRRRCVEPVVAVERQISSIGALQREGESSSFLPRSPDSHWWWSDSDAPLPS